MKTSFNDLRPWFMFPNRLLTCIHLLCSCSLCLEYFLHLCLSKFYSKSKTSQVEWNCTLFGYQHLFHSISYYTLSPFDYNYRLQTSGGRVWISFMSVSLDLPGTLQAPVNGFSIEQGFPRYLLMWRQWRQSHIPRHLWHYKCRNPRQLPRGPGSVRNHLAVEESWSNRKEM